jgi:hypothetical protein
MKYEIVNPSDQCFMEHADPKVAIAACLILGEGRYGLKDPEGNTVLPLVAFGGAKEFLNAAFGGEDAYGSFIADNYGPLSDALASVSLSGERSSMNDIRGRAQRIATGLRERK